MTLQVPLSKNVQNRDTSSEIEGFISQWDDGTFTDNKMAMTISIWRNLLVIEKQKSRSWLI